IVSKDAYRSFSIKNLLSGYFGGSFSRLTYFFDKDENLDINELEKLMDEVKNDVNESLWLKLSTISGRVHSAFYFSLGFTGVSSGKKKPWSLQGSSSFLHR